MIGDPFLNYFALSGNDRNRDLPRHHAISDVRFGISIAQSRQSAFGQTCLFRSAPMSDARDRYSSSRKRTLRRSALATDMGGLRTFRAGQSFGCT